MGPLYIIRQTNRPALYRTPTPGCADNVGRKTKFPLLEQPPIFHCGSTLGWTTFVPLFPGWKIHCKDVSAQWVVVMKDSVIWMARFLVGRFFIDSKTRPVGGFEEIFLASATKGPQRSVREIPCRRFWKKHAFTSVSSHCCVARYGSRERQDWVRKSIWPMTALSTGHHLPSASRSALN